MHRWLMAVLAAFPLLAWAATPKTVTLDVKNMTCELCPVTIRKSLEKLTGVSAVKIDFAKKTATVTFEPDKVQPDALTQATTNAGYPSTVHR